MVIFGKSLVSDRGRHPGLCLPIAVPEIWDGKRDRKLENSGLETGTGTKAKIRYRYRDCAQLCILRTQVRKSDPSMTISFPDKMIKCANSFQ